MYFKTDLDPIGSGLFTDELNIEEGALESQNQNMIFASRRELCEIPSDKNTKAEFFKNYLAWTIVVSRSCPPDYSRGHVCHNVLQENFIPLLTFHAQKVGLTQSFLRISGTISFENIQLTSPCQGRKSW